MKVYVQFSDETETTIVSSFGCPQDATTYPNQAMLDSSDQRYQAFINPASTAAGLWSAYQDQAKAALAQSDKTVLRCVESGVAVPAAWQSYRKALRLIVGSEFGDATQPFPERPSYPAGT